MDTGQYESRKVAVHHVMEWCRNAVEVDQAAGRQEADHIEQDVHIAAEGGDHAEGFGGGRKIGLSVCSSV